ncbi:MAG: amino acid decarboxylase [Acutalibacteraceae bacterium]
MNTPIVDFVKKYAQSGTARFHMPGHKGRGDYASDITEIKGADELYKAEGIIAESENNASSLFGTCHSYYSTEGSTLAVKAMVALASYERPQGEKPLFVAARNVHKAFIYAAAAIDAQVKWLYDDGGHICKCVVTEKQVENAIKACVRKPDGVYITSPDYLGNVADIKKIAQVCDKFDVPLLVDNAHGAYLAFLKENMHPIALGASMCADSAHKTLPVLTGGAYLHIANKASHFCQRARSTLAMYGSTSPSYLILQSLDLCNKYLADRDKAKGESIVKYVSDQREALGKRGIITEGNEPLKLVINAPASGFEGKDLAEYFRSNAIEPEFCDDDYTVLMLSEFNSEKDLDILTKALAKLQGKAPIKREAVKVTQGKQAMSIREAIFSPSERVAVKEAEGRISAQPTVSCPPAVPIVISGEVIDKRAIEAFNRYGVEYLDAIVI